MSIPRRLPPQPPKPPQSLEYAQAQPGTKSGFIIKLATQQRNLMYCLLFQIFAIVGMVVLPEEIRIFGMVGVMAGSIVTSVFVFQMAISMHGSGSGTVLGILTLFPFIGLIVLLIVNGQVTNLLKRSGFKVGLMGADLSKVR